MSARRLATPASIALALLLFAGCAASPLGDRLGKVGEEIDRAKDAGAKDYARADLDRAEASLDAARRLERSSVDGRKAAEAARKAAAEELEATEKSLSDERQALREAEHRVREAEARLAERRRRQDDLRGGGLTSGELGRAIGSDLAIAELAVSEARAAVATATEEIALLEIQARASREHMTGATIASEISGETLLLARALAEQALAAAHMAEARALAGRQAELDARRGEAGRNGA